MKDTYFSDYDSPNPETIRVSKGEEEEIQRHLAQVLQDDDFGVTWVEAFAKRVLQIDKADPSSKEFD